MALNAAVIFEVRNAADFAGASDGNGGGFKAGASGIDYSHASIEATGAPHVTIDGATITATVNATTTKLDIAGYTTAAGDIGNLVNITGGSMTAGLYEIIGQTGGTQWTLDRACGTAAQTGTGAMGGCFATPGKAAAVATVSGHKIWVRSGTTYTITTTTVGAAGPVYVNSVSVSMEGYQATRGDYGTAPILSAGAVSPAASFYLFSAAGNYTITFVNLIADGNHVVNGANVAQGFSTQNARHFVDTCEARNCDGTASAIGFLSASGGINGIRCKASVCSVGFSAGYWGWCVADTCTAGFTGNSENCLAKSCTTGFDLSGALGYTATNCAAQGSSGSTGIGFSCAANQDRFVNCVATNYSGAGGIGFKTTGTSVASLYNCAGYNNATNVSGTFLRNDGFVSLSGDPFVSSSDYRNNATASAGAALRAAGIGQIIAYMGNATIQDIGLGHADPAGGGGIWLPQVEQVGL